MQLVQLIIQTNKCTTFVCVCCAYVGLHYRLFSIYYTKKSHVLSEVWYCTLIHSIKLCELHHCTRTQKHNHARTRRKFLAALWHARVIVFQESVSVTYRLLNLNCSQTYRTSGFFTGITNCSSVPGGNVCMWHTYILSSYARCFRQKM